MARYLVTGGAGFIGSHLAHALIGRGHEVVVADDLSTGFRTNVPTAAGFVELDLAQPGAPDALPPGHYDGVCHFAAQSSGSRSLRDPYGDLQSNLGATVQLIDWCARRGVPRFLLASSMTLYGEHCRTPVDEEGRCEPLAYYAAAKRAAEDYLRIAGRAGGLSGTSARMFNVYGPGQNLGNLDQGMVSIYLAYLLRGVPVPVTGALDRYRDFVYIDDVVAALLALLALPTPPELVYNIATGRPTTVRAVLDHLIKALGLPPDHPVRVLAPPPGEIFGSVGRHDRLTRDTGWSPRVSLEEGITRMVDWARGVRMGD